MENLPSVVEHTTGPSTVFGWPPIVMMAGAASPESDPDTGAALGLVVAPDDVALDVAPDDVALDEVPEDLLSLEQPATPATAIVAAPMPMAINNSRFTEFSLCCDQRPPRGLPSSQVKLVAVEANAVSRLSAARDAFHLPADLRVIWPKSAVLPICPRYF
jgi:hypothetical protein